MAARTICDVLDEVVDALVYVTEDPECRRRINVPSYIRLYEEVGRLRNKIGCPR